MKVVISVTIDPAVLNETRHLAQSKNISVSQLIEQCLREYLESVSTTGTAPAPRIIKCTKCGAEYSSRLPACPRCEESKINAWREERQKKIDEIFASEKISDSVRNMIDKELKGELTTFNIQGLANRIRAIFNFDITDIEVEKKIKELASNVETSF